MRSKLTPDYRTVFATFFCGTCGLNKRIKNVASRCERCEGGRVSYPVPPLSTIST
jgi:hypothetical protein